ncbi:MAG: hypothetical protein ACP5GX_09485, partial [Anaerolineae bacterium]
PPVEVQVGSFPDMLVEFLETYAREPLIPGELFTYTLGWGNQGSIPAGGSWLDVTLPPSVTFEGASNPNYIWNEPENTVSWDLGEVSQGYWENDFQVYVLPAYDLPHGEEVTARAVVDTATPGDPPENNTDEKKSATSHLLVSTWPVPEGPLHLGDQVNFYIRVENKGTQDLQSVIDSSTQGAMPYVPGSATATYGNVEYLLDMDYLVWQGTLPPSTPLTIQYRAEAKICTKLSENGEAENQVRVWERVDGEVLQTVSTFVRVMCPNLKSNATTPTPYLHYDSGLTEQPRARISITYENELIPDLYDAAIGQVRLSVTAGDRGLIIVDASEGFVGKGTGVGYWSLGTLEPGDTGQAWVEVMPATWPYHLATYSPRIWIESRSDEPGEAKRYDNGLRLAIPGVTLSLQKTKASDPFWSYIPGSGYRYNIPYLLTYHHVNGLETRPLAERQSLVDTLPDLFTLDIRKVQSSEPTTKRLSPAQDLEITFATPGLRERDEGWIRFTAIQNAPATINYGDQVVNRAELRFSMQGDNLQEHATFTTTVGLAPPLISFPHTGELCPGEFRVKGIAMPGFEVKIYNANTDQVLATATPDADWNFTSTPINASLPLKIEVKSCTADSSTCSEPTRPVYLFSSTGGWCPQRSWWEGIIKAGSLAGQYQRYDFKSDSGIYSTQGWQMAGVYGFWDTDLNLYGCPCNEPGHTRVMTVVADGVTYTPVSVVGDRFRFFIGGAHNVNIISSCGDETEESPGFVLIDPDGFVFDAELGGDYDAVTGMFDPVQAISGVTVTCMMSAPEQGGWIPWPAHVYSQTNPQVTDDVYPDGITTTGYYAFFTPPGHYYIQVEGVPSTDSGQAPGYQAWRSPVVEVITEIVHVNVPYTPWPVEITEAITLTPDGPDPAAVTVPVGSAVAWSSQLRATDTISDLITWFENPVLHLKSDLDVLLDTDGWDAGYLEPGRIYRRRFPRPGTYAYTDALGHAGTIVVEPAPLYLPLVMKE